MFLDLQEFAFEGQNMPFTVNVLLTCILFRDAGLSYIELFASTVEKFLSQVSYLPSYIFLRRRLSREIHMFLAAI